MLVNSPGGRPILCPQRAKEWSGSLPGAYTQVEISS